MSCTESSDIYWNYDNPSDWSKNFPCASGLCQSPIDINSIDTIPHMYPSFIFSSKYNSDKLFTLKNNGRQICTTVSKSMDEHKQNDLWFSGSGLPGVYHFQEFHIHWGQSNRHGSEHKINGRRFSGEAHFVHKNYDNGQIAVLAFFFSTTAADVVVDNNNEHHEWDKYAEVASRLTKIHDTTNCTFNLSKLMQIDDREFFRYMGSLTTPPCTEGIIWTVFSYEIPIKASSLDLLRQNIMRKVCRPVQPINGRTIFRNHHYSKIT
ncbi:unnamed protein product [Adineta steineri]|uniref:Carbonic anhydrase n=1 Tax=Adineta steineri TaxID=433720 RepID=A0A819IA83_9BILA|nr:unnamed protein product [Adineta steineri]CAF3913166.1 unnamed protein product [Adineta steineri]